MIAKTCEKFPQICQLRRVKMVTTGSLRRILRQVAQSGWARLVNRAIDHWWRRRRISVLAKTDKRAVNQKKNNAL